jgi:hypothetical protein
MGATIYYKQVTPKDRQDLEVLAPSSFTNTMERGFGNSPWRLSSEDIPVLKGMAAAHRDDSDNPFSRLIRAIEELDEIEVWPEW